MKELWTGIKRFLVDDEGATATEYAVMLALIIVVSIIAIQLVGNKVNNTFSEVGSRLP